MFILRSLALCTVLSFVTQTAVAQNQKTILDCAMGDQLQNGRLAKELATFTKDTPLIYLLCSSQTVKAGQTVKVVWIADDTKGAAPANTKIAEKALPISRNANPDLTWTGTYSITKPTNNWPAGTYHADIFVNNSKNQSINFSIK